MRSGLPIRRLALAAALAALCLLPSLALARSLAQRKIQALAQFESAEKMREELNGRPQSERTARDYGKVIAAYRRVYFITPNSSKADASIVTMAELLAEQGRAFEDTKASQESIKQYEFLIEQYPGSRHKTEALFTIGKIYQEDLGDDDAAKTAFEDFLQQHPRHRLSPAARQAIADIEHPAKPPGKKSAQPVIAKAEASSGGAQKGEIADVKSQSEPASKPVAAPLVNGRRPLVTGIRHWSTPDYTRVAIDLEEEIPYEAGRIPSPDRIFFDLHGTKLAPELVGKSFDVEDGFLKRIRVAQYQPGMTRVVLEVAPVSEYSAFLLPNPYRLIVDIHGQQPTSSVSTRERPPFPAEMPQPKTSAENSSSAAAMSSRSAAVIRNEVPADAVRKNAAISSTTPSPVKPPGKSSAARSDAEEPKEAPAESKTAEVKATERPTTLPTFQAVTPREEHKPSRGKEKEREIEAIAREAKPSADGQRGLIRALGLKIGKIVVDAGHGGHDTGTIGPRGLMEKDLVLDVSLRLGKLLENRLGADVIYTRNDDTFIPLETRTAVANQSEADLFISVHANSSHDSGARGVETYYLNFTSSPEALEVAARENAVSDKSIHELQDLVKKIALKEKIEESREFATDVQHALHSGLSSRGNSMRDRGVKKAPFIVLIGANMPSVLAEISFVSNPKDERKLQTPEYRQKIAESLYRGIGEYVRGLSGVKLASAGAAR